MRIWPVASAVAWRTLKNVFTNPALLFPSMMFPLFFFTAFAGGLYGVNPFDQPGVEAGKRYACGILGRPGYEKDKEEMDARPARKPELVL